MSAVAGALRLSDTTVSLASRSGPVTELVDEETRLIGRQRPGRLCKQRTELRCGKIAEYENTKCDAHESLRWESASVRKIILRALIHLECASTAHTAVEPRQRRRRTRTSHGSSRLDHRRRGSVDADGKREVEPANLARATLAEEALDDRACLVTPRLETAIQKRILRS